MFYLLHQPIAFIKAWAKTWCHVKYVIILVRGLNGGLYGWILNSILDYCVPATILIKWQRLSMIL